MLDAACSACTIKVLKYFEYFAPLDMLRTSIWLNLVCFQLKGKYCILTFQQATASAPTPGQAPNDQQLSLMCDDCTQAFVARHVVAIAFLVGNATEVEQELNFLKLTRVMCITDLKGEYCFPKIQNANSTLRNFGDVCLPEVVKNTCTADCNKEIVAVKQDLGCCFGTWYNFLVWQYQFDPTNYQLPYAPPAIQNFVVNQCKQSIPLGCATKKVVLHIIWNNFAWGGAWYQANVDKVKNDLTNYLAFLLTVDQSFIANVTISPAVNGVKVLHSTAPHFDLLGATTPNGLALDATVNAQDDTQVTSVSTNANAAGGSSNPFIASWPLEARNDPSSPVLVAASTSTIVFNGSAATAPVYSLVLFAAALLSLLLL